MHDEQDDVLLPRTWLAGLGVVSFLVLASLAPRVMGEGDSAEFTLALALTGVPHPPGYPLYTLAGSVFVHALRGLGFGWAHAANLWSAVGAAIAILLTAALADRMILSALRLGRAPRAILVAAALAVMAVNPVFMRAATQAEVYSWEVAWTALSALAALALLDRIETRVSASARSEVLASLLWGALMGVVLAHRPTMAATAVPLTIVLAATMARHARLRPAVALAAVSGACLPVTGQLFIAWRAAHPAAFQWPMLQPTAQSVLAHASGRYYRAYLGGGAGGDGGGQFGSALLPVFVFAALAAVLAAPRLRGSRAGMVLLALIVGSVLQGAFVAVYHVSDFVFFLLPLLVPAVVLLACGAAVLLGRVAAPVIPSALLLAIVALFAALAVRSEMAHARAIAQIDDDVRAAFIALPFERGVVVWNSDSWTRLLGYQLLERRKPGIVVLNGSVLTWQPARRAVTQRLGFDPLAGLTLRTDADLALIARHVASHTGQPVVDFGVWWESGGAASR